MIRVTKDVLRKLNATVGKLDTDSGQVFVGFIGRLERGDGLYHGDVHFEDPDDVPPQGTVSVQAILNATGAEKPKHSTPAPKPKPKHTEN